MIWHGSTGYENIIYERVCSGQDRILIFVYYIDRYSNYDIVGSWLGFILSPYISKLFAYPIYKEILLAV